MPDDFLLVSLLAIPWVLLGGLILKWCANFFEKTISIRRAMVTQFLTVVVLPFWLRLQVMGFHGLDLFPERKTNLHFLLLASVYQFLVIKVALRISVVQSIIVWVASAFATIFLLEVVFMGTHIDNAGYRMVVSKANAGLRTISTALHDYKKAVGAFPIPVDDHGTSLEPRSSEAKSISYATEKTEIYYQGPSFVPDILIERGVLNVIPSDPFRITDPGPYGYGAGPITGASAAFILTSRGPDMESQAEDLEYLYLDKLRGDNKAFRMDPESLSLLYSPTNGTVSPGDLCRGNR